MKKFIKFVFLCVVIAALVVLGMRAYTYFSNDIPDIEDREWRLVVSEPGTSEYIVPEYPIVHGVEGAGSEESMLVDVRLTFDEGKAYIWYGNEILFESGMIDGERDSENNYIKDGGYYADFEGVECYISAVKLVKDIQWATEETGFDGNLYGKYMITLEVVASPSNYTILFFAD